jgi:fatty-acyl-CoA synthase
MPNPYQQDLDKNAANYQPLTPLTYLERAAKTFPDHVAIIHGNQRITYRDFWGRSLKLASALAAKNIGKGDTVTVMLSNTPPMLEAHFGVPMVKAVLHCLNTRLDAAVIAFQIDHAQSKVLIVDREFSGVVKQALTLTQTKPLVIDYDDPDYADDAPYPKGERIGSLDYEDFIAGGDENFAWSMPDDEWDAISLNYTSGTTGNPKGVVYHHRGAALMAYTNAIHGGMAKHCVYLWTLPMFHCNGWCFPWTLAVQAGTHVCLRWVRAKSMYDAIADHGVTHLCGAPVVMSVLINARDEDKRQFPQIVTFSTAAAPPPEAVLSGMADAGFAVTHLYGLTETYGPAVVNEWHAEWDALEKGPRTVKKARQGVRYAALEALTVMDPDTMVETPADGETIGEVMFRGAFSNEVSVLPEIG